MSKLFPKIPLHEDDCECLDICLKLGRTYERCYKGVDILIGKRCEVIQRQLLLQSAITENQNKRKTNVALIIAVLSLFVGAAGLIVALTR